MKFKGPVFPSYRNQGPGGGLHRVYLQHTSTARQLRNLKQWTRPIIDSKDPAVIAAGLRVIRDCKDEPNPEFTIFHLFHAGMKMAEETKQPWPVCMDVIMDKFAERKDADGQVSPLTQNGLPLARQAEPEAAPAGPSLFRRLLRSPAPRPHLQGAEASAEGDQHQPTGVGDVTEKPEERQGSDPPQAD